MMGAMRVHLVVLTLCAVARVAIAQPVDPAAKARADAAYAEGSTAYNANEFAKAALKFEEAYAHVPDPAYLFNIGQAYRQAKECVKAAGAFQKFIELVPGAPNIDNAKELLQEQNTCAVFVEGRRLMGAGRPAEACEKFKLAHRDDPGAVGTLLNLGLCSEQMGKLATAASWFRQAQKKAIEVKLDEADQQAKAHLDVLVPKIPKIDIKVPANATVKLDGNDVLVFVGVEVDPGRHTLVVEAPGMKPETQSFDVSIGARETVAVSLTPISAPSRHSNRLAIILGTTGLTLWAGTAALGLVGKSKYDDAATRDDQQKWKDIVRYGGTTMFVLGTAAMTTSIVLYVRGRKGSAESAVLAPAAGPGHVALTLGGSF